MAPAADAQNRERRRSHLLIRRISNPIAFRPPWLKRSTILIAVFLIANRASPAIELRAETIGAFDRFIAAVETRLEPCFNGQHFLWSDESPGVRQQLLNGMVVAQPVQGNGSVAFKGGMVQDWQGAVFISRAKLKDVLAVVQDYDHHRDFYKPDIEAARIVSRQGDEFLVYMRVVKKKFSLADVLNTEQAIRFVQVDPRKVYSRSYSKSIREVAAAGQPDEHELPPGQDRGLLWRLYGYWFFEERDDGVYITCESITLTRDIPYGLAVLLGPLLHDLPGESLRKSLEQTRRAVLLTKP
jgi:hypothetical protein